MWSFARSATFALGLRVHPRSDLEELAERAFLFLPMHTIPAWATDQFPPVPPDATRDASNGWFATYPIQKLQHYQRCLRCLQVRDAPSPTVAVATAMQAGMLDVSTIEEMAVEEMEFNASVGVTGATQRLDAERL